MQTKLLRLPNSSCTFMHSANAHKAETTSTSLLVNKSSCELAVVWSPILHFFVFTTVTCLEHGHKLLTPGW